MKYLPLAVGIASLALGLVILVFAEGLRRYYSGLFFVLMGLLLLWRVRSEGVPAGPDRDRVRARSLFGGGLVFFMIGIVLSQVTILGLAIAMLVGALVYHWRNTKRPGGSRFAG